MALAFISGFTFTIIPALGTDQYTMSLEALDPQGQALSKGSNHDAINTWLGIWFIPMMAYTPKEAVADTFTRQVNALLKQMVESNHLKYSALDAGVPRAERAECRRVLEQLGYPYWDETENPAYALFLGTREAAAPV